MALKANMQATSAATLAFAQFHAAKISRGTDINDQHDGQLTLLGEFLHKGVTMHLAKFRRDIPIDGTNFVAWGWYCRTSSKFIPRPLNTLRYWPENVAATRPPRLQLETADFFENGAGGIHSGQEDRSARHHGTGSPAKMVSMICSLVFSSASAS